MIDPKPYHFHVFYVCEGDVQQQSDIEASNYLVYSTDMFACSENRYAKFYDNHDNMFIEHILPFLDRVKMVDVLNVDERKKFVGQWNEFIKELKDKFEDSVVQEMIGIELVDADVGGGSIYEDTMFSYVLFCDTFSRVNKIRFGIVDGMHRSLCLVSLPTDPNTVLEQFKGYARTSSMVYISNFMSTEKKQIKDQMDDLKTMSMAYTHSADIDVGYSELDIVKNLYTVILQYREKMSDFRTFISGTFFHSINWYAYYIEPFVKMNNVVIESIKNSLTRGKLSLSWQHFVSDGYVSQETKYDKIKLLENDDMSESLKKHYDTYSKEKDITVLDLDQTQMKGVKKMLRMIDYGLMGFTCAANSQSREYFVDRMKLKKARNYMDFITVSKTNGMGGLAMNVFNVLLSCIASDYNHQAISKILHPKGTSYVHRLEQLRIPNTSIYEWKRNVFDFVTISKYIMCYWFLLYRFL